MRAYHGQSAADQSRRAGRSAQPLPVHAAGHRHRRAVPLGADPRGQDSAAAGPRGRQQRSAGQESADSDRHGSRQDLGARADGESGRDRALQRVRDAPGVADLRAQQSVSGRHAGRAGIPARSGGAVDVVRPLVRRPADPAQHRRKGDHQRGTAHGRPHRPAAVGDDFVQSQAGRGAGRRRVGNPGGGRADAAVNRWRPAFRARRRRSRIRCRGWD